MQTISNWLILATKELKSVGIESARLDAEIILAHTLRKSRTWLHAHGDDALDPRSRDIAEARLDLRHDHTPIAYIIGHKEFYGRQFHVTPSTLIPRPDSEILIDLLKKHIDTAKLFQTPPQQLVDIGTGSGCLGITAKLELPELAVTLTDTSRHALAIARKNAESLGADVEIIESNLLSHYALKPDYILANLPYVDRAWHTNEETRHEPEMALFADDNGLALIKKLIVEAQTKQTSGALLLLEADPRQHDDIKRFAHEHEFQTIDSDGFGLVLARL